MTDGGPGLASLDVDVEGALEQVNVPSYVIDRDGVIRWLNGAARRLVGDQVGRQFTSVVAPEETRRAREIFARNLLGARKPSSSVVVLDDGGRRVEVEVSGVPLRRGDVVVGMFGQVADIREAPATPRPELPLTPRQAEVLHHLEQGCSTVQIADHLQLSPATVRNHVRHLLLALGCNSRLEAVAAARGRIDTNGSVGRPGRVGTVER